MELTKEFLQKLQNKLKIGDRRSTHLNALIKNSSYKLDFSILSIIDEKLPQKFLETLFSKQQFDFQISWKDKEIDLFNIDDKDHKKFEKIDKVFTNLKNQVQSIKEERGVETFGFGYPLFIKKGADNKLIVAPLIIWKLGLKRSNKNNTWHITKEEDSTIYLNEVLINYLQSEANIILSPLDNDVLDDGVIDKTELKTICKDVIERTNVGKIDKLDENLEEIFSEITEIKTQDKYEKLPLNEINSFIENAGLFSYFEIQKHSIIQNYENLIELEGEKISEEKLEYSDFQTFTSVETDPSQQQLLNNISQFRNIIIQGPPGTGKSQTLTALLTNALENDKKCLVVCEKNTALQVLKDSLEKVGLGNHIAFIHDATGDRQKVVSAVRNKIKDFGNHNFGNIAQNYLSTIKSHTDLISSINEKHKALANKILAEYNWTDIVGKYLKNYRLNNHSKKTLRKTLQFDFNYQEYDDWRILLREGNKLYRNFHSTGGKTYFPNEKILSANNFYAFENDFIQSVENYQDILNDIQNLKKQITQEYIEDRLASVKQQIENIEALKIALAGHQLNFRNIIEAEKANFSEMEVNDILKFRENLISKKNRYIGDKLSEIQDFKNFVATKKNDFLKTELSKLNNIARKIQIRKENFFQAEKIKFDKEKLKYFSLLNKIDEILDHHQNNPNFISEEKTDGIFFNIKSWFSDSIKKVIEDSKIFDDTYNQLVGEIQNSVFFHLKQHNHRTQNIESYKKLRENIRDFDIKKYAKNKFCREDLPKIINFKTYDIPTLDDYISKSGASRRHTTLNRLEDFIFKLDCRLDSLNIKKIGEKNFYAEKLETLIGIGNKYITEIAKYIKESGLSQRSKDIEIIEDFINCVHLASDFEKSIERTFYSTPLGDILATTPFDVEAIINYIVQSGISQRNEDIERIEDFIKRENIDIAVIKTLAERKFVQLNLDEILNPEFNNYQRIKDFILEKKQNTTGNQNNILTTIYHTINDFSIQQEGLWNNLKTEINNTKDFIFDTTSYPENYVNNAPFINEIEDKIKQISDNINEKINDELQKSDDTDFQHLPSYSKKQEKTKHLQDLIQEQNYGQNADEIIRIKEDIFDKNPNVLQNIYHWVKFYEPLNKIQKYVIDNIKDEEHWEYAFLTYYIDKLLINNGVDIIPTDDNYVKDFTNSQRKLEKNQIQYINYKWHNTQKESVRRFNAKTFDFKVENLYNLRGQAGRRRFSLRNIIESDCDLFTDLHPIILTTPDVASILFKHQNKYFDFVIFDEASQLRLEDNLPAMLKGKQIIVAGDEHQMPPSNYFSKIVSGEIDNEDDIQDDDIISIERVNATKEELLLSASSLLEAANELNFENKDLTFHYRSKHPYLIDFSNYAFYKQKLIPMPITSDYKPIKYVNVDGIYENNINEKEAEVVLSILENNIHRNKSGEYPSVGIATFNIKQRDFIKNKIIERQKLDENSEFSRKIAELEENGFFVKNLENIQGDERDVIILSTTYGKTEKGDFAQRFGSLNQQKGYKLLNVIITRAKYKNYVVTSIPEDKILDYNTYLLGQQTNYGKAPLYAYLAYAKAVSDGNEEQRMAILNNLARNSEVSDNEIDTSKLESIFEEEVYERLSQTDLKDYIQLQYQVGGFRIDMVIDFRLPNVPKIAIECDGAKYHSSNEAYLYDYHRQKILESHGFKFHRIWGTNWWRNPEYEMEQLLDFIKKVRNRRLTKLQNNEINNIFSDEVIVEDSEVVEPLVNDEDTLFDTTALQDDEIIIEKESSLKIKLDSKVKFEYIDTREQFDIVISTETNTDVHPIKVAQNHPLGKVLLGRSIGDIVQVDGFDKFVRILDIID